MKFELALTSMPQELEIFKNKGWIKGYVFEETELGEVLKDVEITLEGFREAYKKFVFVDVYDLAEFVKDFPKLINEKTKIMSDKLILEYGQAYVGPFWHNAVFLFNLITKRLLVFIDLKEETNKALFNLASDEAELKELKKLLKQVRRNFEYLQSIRNTLMLSDDMVFDVFALRQEDYKYIFNKIKNELKQRFWLLSEAYYDLLASFIVLSYFPELLETAPYIFLGGEKGSGKSRVLEALADYCYRTSKTGNISVAVMARETDFHKTTLIFDEIVKNEEKQTQQEQELFALLRSGNRKGYYYKRMKNDTVIGIYDAFGLKAFATNRDLPSDIKDRCVQILMFKNVKFKPKIERVKDYNFIRLSLSEMRIQLLLFTDIDKVKRALKEFAYKLISKGVEGRLAETISPLLFFIPNKKVYYKLIVEIMKTRLQEEELTETFRVYQAIKTILANEGVFENIASFDKGKKFEIMFNQIVRKYCEDLEIDYDNLHERDKKSITIRVGLILRSKFGFETIRKSVRLESGIIKERYAVVDFAKFLSFYERYELENLPEKFKIANVVDVFKDNSIWTYFRYYPNL